MVRTESTVMDSTKQSSVVLRSDRLIIEDMENVGE